MFEFELELHLMLVWGHFFELDWLLVQSADVAALASVRTVLGSALAKKQPAERSHS